MTNTTIPKLPHLLSPGEAAKAIRVTEDTLAVWRCTGRYELPFVKIGRKVFYRSQDIENFIESRLHNSHSSLRGGV